MSSEKKKEKLSLCAKIDKQCRSFAQFAYNKETGEVMGRSNKSWGKIGLFYFAYYGFLTAFFSTCLTIFLSMLNDPGKGGPKTIQFLIGDSAPGLTTIPSADNLKRYGARPNGNGNDVKNYLDGFKNQGYTGPNCQGDRSQQLCKFNMTSLGDCGKGSFGYASTNYTCVIVKLNKVYGWKPKSNLGLSCYGAKDMEILPKEGYFVDGFPFKGQSWYQTPPVVLKIPKLAGKAVIRCTLKGDGIKVSDVYQTSRAYGRIEFTLSP